MTRIGPTTGTGALLAKETVVLMAEVKPRK